MSKNFELLQRAAKDEWLNPPPMFQSVEHVLAPRDGTDLADSGITKLVQRLFYQGRQGGGPKVVSFSGIARDDRSGWICARAGEVLAAQKDTSVCVVEANVWSPRLRGHVNSDTQVGLADVFLGLTPNRSVSVDHYQARFAELREAFDYVLISAPALSRESDAILIGQSADGLVLIIEANRSRRETVRRAKEQLENAHVRLLGAVLDQRTFPIPERLYQKL